MIPLLTDNAVWAVAVFCLLLGGTIAVYGMEFLAWLDRREERRRWQEWEVQERLRRVGEEMHTVVSVRVGNATVDADGIHVHHDDGSTTDFPAT